MVDSTENHSLEKVKQEDDSDLEASEGQESNRGGASTFRSPHEHVQRVIEQPTNLDESIQFVEAQAALTSYPPGCPVLHVNARQTPPVVTVATVNSVSFSTISRELQFCIKPAHGGDAFTVSESQLQYAPLCRVEATVNSETGPRKRQVFILTSYQLSPNSVALYSVQEDGGCGSIFHGVPKESIKYLPNVASSMASPVETSISIKQPVAASVAVEATNTSGTLSPSGLKKRAQPQGRIEMNSFYPGHSDQSPTMQSAHRIDNAVSTSFGNETNSTAKRSLVNTRKVSPDAPTKRRKSNEGGPIASPSQNEAMDRELHSPRRSRSSGKHTSPEQLTRKQLPAAKRERNDDFASASTTILTSRTRNRDQCDDCETTCTKFIIPGCSFRVATTKDFFRENKDTIERNTNCRISFRSQRRNDLWQMHLEVNGTPKDVYHAKISIERLLVRTLCHEEQGRALYYMALLNEHRDKNTHNKVVRQYCCHWHKEEMKYMYVKRLPENYEEIIGYCIGKSGSRKKSMENASECKIDINMNDTQQPHYAVYGDTEEDVLECTRQIEDVLEEANDIKRREYSQHN